MALMDFISSSSDTAGAAALACAACARAAKATRDGAARDAAMRSGAPTARRAARRRACAVGATLTLDVRAFMVRGGVGRGMCTGAKRRGAHPRGRRTTARPPRGVQARRTPWRRAWRVAWLACSSPSAVSGCTEHGRPAAALATAPAGCRHRRGRRRDAPARRRPAGRTCRPLLRSAAVLRRRGDTCARALCPAPRPAPRLTPHNTRPPTHAQERCC